MKKLTKIFMIFALVAAFTSCNQVEFKSFPLGNEIDFSSRDMVSVAMTNIAVTEKGSRAISHADETTNLLVYYDKAGNMKPFVFRNDENNYILFKVKNSYTVGEGIIAIDFEGMYYSQTLPVIEKAGAPGAEYPVVDFESGIDLMNISGQAIINMEKGKGAFLTPIDFSRFSKNPDTGVFEYGGLPDYVDYKLDNSVTVDGKLIVIRELFESNDFSKAVYSIDLNDLSKAVPMTSPENFHPLTINDATSEYIHLNGIKDQNKDYILRTDGKYGVVPIPTRSEEIRVTDDGYSMHYSSILDGLYHIGDSFWILEGNPTHTQYLTDKDGNPIYHSLKNGFWFDGVHYDGAEIKYFEEGSVSTTDKRFWFCADRDGYLSEDEGSSRYYYSDQAGEHKIEGLNKRLGGELYDWQGKPLEITSMDESGFVDKDGVKHLFSYDKEGRLGISAEKVFLSLDELAYDKRMKPAKGTDASLGVPLCPGMEKINGFNRHPKIVNMKPAGEPGKYMLWIYVENHEQTGIASSIYKVLFDTNGEGSMTFEGSRMDYAIKLPENYRVSSLRPQKGNETSVSDRDGSMVFWLDMDANQMRMMNIETGETVMKDPGPRIAKNWISKVGDRIFLKLQGEMDGSSIYTYSISVDEFLDNADIEPFLRLESVSEMTIVPLVEFNVM